MDNRCRENHPKQSSKEGIFTGMKSSSGKYGKSIPPVHQTILAIGALVILSSPDYEYFWLNCIIWAVLAACFVALGIWAKKKPYQAIVAALILYIVVIGLNGVLDITTLSKALLMKAIIIVLLLKGIYDAKKMQEL
ncbi:MAG: hypothetical protein JWQ27_2490 [Ferruginibacter sp.]|nr:hypothetical protein [Ferruginibacter sp.]